MTAHREGTDKFLSAETNAKLLEDPGSGGTIDLRGISGGLVVAEGVGTRTLPADAPVGVDIYVARAGSGTITFDLGSVNVSLAHSNRVYHLVKISDTEWGAVESFAVSEI
ncbi:MAG: hypothetical protein AAGB04_00085 [Pseudomonadota bacterium]